MARAETDPTRIDDAASKASSDWLSIVKDIFPQTHDHLGSTEATKAKLRALFDDPETRLRIRRVDANGEEVPNTRRSVGVEFCQDHLSVVPDPNSGDDHIAVDYSDPYVDYYTPGGHWELEVRRRDVERLHPELATPPLAPGKESTSAPASSESNKSRQKPGPKPDFSWEKAEAKCYHLMDHNGDFTPDDPDWDCQARLEEELMTFFQNTDGRQPAPSTLREKLPGWLSTWHERKTSGA
jgi:hypothetical protein